METGSESKKVVLLAMDDSECSHYALEWTLLNLHETVAKSELILFTAQPISDYSYLYASSMGVAPPELIKTFREQRQKAAEALLEKAKDLCEKRGITAKTVTEVGDPKDQICEAAEKLKAQLLVLGSHGRGLLGRTFLGSVSNYCAHNAKCPVLVVRKTN